MAKDRKKPRAPKISDEETVILREHVYVVNDADSYFGLIRRIRHADYALDGILRMSEALPGTSHQLREHLGEARALTEEWRELELPVGWHQGEDGTLDRTFVEMDGAEIVTNLRRRVVHWQESERCLGDIYRAMALAALDAMRKVDPKVRDGMLPEIADLYILGTCGHSDPELPVITYQVAFDPSDSHEITVEDWSGRRSRAEADYRMSLKALAAATVARRDRKRNGTLVWLTIVLVVLTLVLVAQTAVMILPKEPTSASPATPAPSSETTSGEQGQGR